MAAKYVYTFCLLLASAKCQKTAGFNDYTSTGTEREVNLLYRDVELYKENSTLISKSVARYDNQVNDLNLPSKTKLYVDINSAMSKAGELASKAGFPQCASKGVVFTIVEVPKYQSKIHSLYDLYTASALSSKAKATSLSGLLNTYSETADINFLRTCTLAKIFGNAAVTNCYKTNLATVTTKVKAAGNSMAAANAEFEVTTRRFNEFVNGVDAVLAAAKEATDLKVEEILECAKLSAKPIVTETLNKIEQIKTSAATYINTNIEGLTEGVNALKGRIDLKKNLTESLLRSSVQAFYSLGSFGKIIFPKSTVNIETEINNKINLNVENAAKKLNTVFSTSTTKLNNFLNKINAWASKYNIDVGYFTESNLTALCVPKNIMEQLANRQKITQCLNDLLAKFTTVANQGKLDIDQLLTEYVTVQADADLSTQIDASVEAELIANTKADVYNFFKQTFGILPNKLSITTEVGKMFNSSGSVVSTLINRVADVKNEINNLNTLVKTTKDTINTQIQTTLNPLTVAISDIKKINPYYNVNALITAQSNLNSQIQANLTAYFNSLNANVDAISLQSLNFDYNLEFEKFQIEMNKCFLSDTLELEKVFACLSPIIDNFNSSLNRAVRLTEHGQTDIKLLISNFPNDIKQFTTNLFTAISKQVNTIVTSETNKAKTEIDYSNELIDQLKDEINEKIKTPVEQILTNYTKVTVSLKGDSITYNDDLQKKIIEPLINAYNKSYQVIPNQFLSFDSRLDLINDLNFNKDLSAALIDNYFVNRNDPIIKVINETAEDIDLNLARFAVALKKSYCYKAVKAIFLACINGPLTEFRNNITNAVWTINNQTIFLGFLNSRVGILQEQGNVRILRLLNESKIEIDNQNYLIDRSQQYLKTVLNDAPKRMDIVSKINGFGDVLSSLYNNFQNSFKTAVEPFRIAVNNSELVNAYVGLQQNKIKSKLDQLKVLIEFGKLKLNNIDDDLNTAIESYKNFKINCAISNFKSCVDAYYYDLDWKFSTIVDAFNNTSNTLVGTTEAEIVTLKKEIDNILKETAEKIQSENNKKSNAEAMEQLVKDTIAEYRVTLNSLSPVFNTAYVNLNKLEANLTNVISKSKTDANLNVTLTVGGLTMVKSAKGDGICNYIDVVGGTIEAGKAQLQLLQNAVNLSTIGFDESYLNVQCDNSTSLVSIKECLKAQIVLPKLDFSGVNSILANIAISS